MPIGVPKVPFRIPGDEDASWVDIYNRLYRERLLFLCQEIDYEIGNQLAGLIIYLGIEDTTQEQYFFIHSPGGAVIPGMSIHDAMQLVLPEVNTIGMGLAASMGSLLLVAGEITKRLAYPRARVMIHQPVSAFYQGATGEFVMEASELIILRETLTRVYVRRTGKPQKIVAADMERDVFMSATEAKAYGIVDLVGID